MTEATLAARFWAKVKLADGEGCWEWLGAKNESGYGHISNGRTKCLMAHRVSLGLAGVEIPAGFHVDHLCQNPGCVRPDHLEPVTPGENSRRVGARKQVCTRGHSLSGDRARIAADGRRICIECRRLRQREARDRMRRDSPGLGSGSFQRGKIQCPQGHPYNEENTYRSKRGSRSCKACQRGRKKRALNKLGEPS